MPTQDVITMPDLPDDYDAFLRDIKAEIQSAQTRVALAVSRELILLYWRIGRDITEKQTRHGWGDKVLDRLAFDLKTALPGVEGFSPRNLYRMRAFYQAYPNENEFVTQAVSQIPWGHSITIFQKLKDQKVRLWYAQ